MTRPSKTAASFPALSRRRCLTWLAGASLAAGLRPAAQAYAQAARPEEAAGGTAFSRETVIDLARRLAQQPFQPLPQAPEVLQKLDYSEYRKINYQKDAAVWGASPTKFSIQLFAPGFLYRDLVDIDIVENGKARPLKVGPHSFRVPDPALGKLLADVAKYAGMRLHYPLNRPDYADEFLVFQGASFFRGVSKGQLYGLSARGLAIDVAQSGGEEHPIFRRFWVERPSKHQDSMVVHALLDSQRVTGAYRFGIYPGAPLRMDINVILFPRADLDHVGLAPLTSMFMHGPLDAPDKPDYRPAVHDSGGLAIERGNGERIWRPLANPRGLQASAFLDENPKGFGLIQRHRDFAYYQDLEAKYHRRPSAWVRPLGDWGKGQVELIEIPSDSEANDNIVAYWRPQKALKAGQAFEYAYRLTWPDDAPGLGGAAKVARSAGGTKLFDGHHEIMIDYAGLEDADPDHIKVEASISQGRIVETNIHPNPHVGGGRVFVSFDDQGAKLAELRVELKREGKPVGETWLYRWTDGG